MTLRWGDSFPAFARVTNDLGAIRAVVEISYLDIKEISYLDIKD